MHYFVFIILNAVGVVTSENVTLTTLNAVIPTLDNKQEPVVIHLFYESHCPYSMEFYNDEFKPIVELLGPHLEIHTYPYGNALTEEVNGTYEFECQHGPNECYGNKLHACAIDVLQTVEKYVLYNGCMMNSTRADRGSNDDTADSCGKLQNIDSESIKNCAKGDKGTQLLKNYGVETKKLRIRLVPHIVVNDQKSNRNNFQHDVCAALKNPPEACKEKYIVSNYELIKLIFSS